MSVRLKQLQTCRLQVYKLFGMETKGVLQRPFSCAEFPIWETTSLKRQRFLKVSAVLKIGSIRLDVPFFQASLAGYSDLAMRNLACRFGSPLTFNGVMIDTLAMHPSVVNKHGFTPAHDQHPVGAQLVGTESKMMSAAARFLFEAGYDLIDLNFACPAPKVLRRGRGGSMLRNPNRVLEIYRRVREAVPCPVTMKLRIGYDESEGSKEDFWAIAENSAAEGIDALIIHGRTVSQDYRGRADWDIPAKLKRRFPLTTIIGSGDIFTPESVLERLKETGIDGVAIARGAIGNPWIFSQTRSLYEAKSKPSEPTIEEQADIMLWHFEEVIKLHGRRKGVGYFRKFSVHYCRLHPEKRHVRKDLLAADNPDGVRAAIKYWYGRELIAI
jgi:tRNA-dihydrouridine synthase B